MLSFKDLHLLWHVFDPCCLSALTHGHALIAETLEPRSVRLTDRPIKMEFEESGIGEECGVFGCVAAGEWPTQLEVAQILTLGLVALQHR